MNCILITDKRSPNIWVKPTAVSQRKVRIPRQWLGAIPNA